MPSIVGFLKSPLETLLLEHLINLDSTLNYHGPQWHQWRCKCMCSDSVFELQERFQSGTENYMTGVEMAAEAVRYKA